MPRVPKECVAGLATVEELFSAIAESWGLPAGIAEEVVALLPSTLRETACFLDRLTSVWRYDFGLPFDGFPSGGYLLGTHMFVPVGHLFVVLFYAKQRLSPQELALYLQRLFDPPKHLHTLNEFIPIVRIIGDIQVQFEVSGYGEGQTTIDWLINAPADIRILLDVKSRVSDLFQQFVEIDKGRNDLDGTAPAPTHDVAFLFRSLEKKFRPMPPEEILQGAWILTQIKQERTELSKAFKALDPLKVHFAILGDWDEDVYVLARAPWIREKLLRIFRAKQSDRFVFDRKENKEMTETP